MMSIVEEKTGTLVWWTRLLFSSVKIVGDLCCSDQCKHLPPSRNHSCGGKFSFLRRSSDDVFIPPTFVRRRSFHSSDVRPTTFSFSLPHPTFSFSLPTSATPSPSNP